MQAAGRVDDDDVRLDLAGGLDRVERDRRRVGALLLGADRGYPDPRAPRLELVRGGGAERVRRPEDTSRSSETRTRASLPTVVVLPVPLTPTTRMTAGRPSMPRRGDPAVHLRVDEVEQVGLEPAP